MSYGVAVARLNRRDRRVLITVVGTLLWIAIGNAGLHMRPLYVYVIAVFVAVLLWLVTGTSREEPPNG